MTAAIVSLAPIFLYILVLKLLDSFALVHWKTLVLCMIYGIAGGAAILGLVRITGPIELAGISVVPLIEEIVKGALIVWMVLHRKMKFLAEALIYGASVGGGFALIENVIYLVSQPDMAVVTAIFRGFGCAFLHIGCTALIATLMLLLVNKLGKISAVIAFLPSVVLHFLHNEMDPSPVLTFVSTLVLFSIIFVVLFSLGEKIIYKWMDHSISFDVMTLSAIKAGNFASTKAGMYMLDVKEQFKPEVFFDMINYLELYLDLKIERQSLMLLNQAGFSPDEMGISTDVHKEKMTEFKALGKFIGQTARQVLSPLVRPDDLD